MNEQKIASETTLDITSSDQLEKLERIVHDEFFELDKVKFLREKNVLEIPYRRIFHGGPSRTVKGGIIAKVVEVDVVRAMLIIHHVNEYSVQDSAHIGTYSFNSISYDGHALIIACCEPLELRIAISKFLVQSRYLEVRGKARIKHGLFWDSNTCDVYE